MKKVHDDLLRYGSQLPVVNHHPQPRYAMKDQDYGMTVAVAATKGGRVFVCWVGGGDNPKAYFLLSHSDDQGKTWCEPELVIDPHDERISCDRCTIVGTLVQAATGTSVAKILMPKTPSGRSRSF